MKKYEIIYADPAWEYNTKECLAKTSILNGELNTHYSTMTLKELKALDVQSILIGHTKKILVAKYTLHKSQYNYTNGF